MARGGEDGQIKFTGWKISLNEWSQCLKKQTIERKIRYHVPKKKETKNTG